jgi:hypothetical protein
MPFITGVESGKAARRQLRFPHEHHSNGMRLVVSDPFLSGVVSDLDRNTIACHSPLSLARHNAEVLEDLCWALKPRESTCI